MTNYLQSISVQFGWLCLSVRMRSLNADWLELTQRAHDDDIHKYWDMLAKPLGGGEEAHACMSSDMQTGPASTVKILSSKIPTDVCRDVLYNPGFICIMKVKMYSCAQ